MDVPATDAVSPMDPGNGDRSFRLLRARWRMASLSSGWKFPSDWSLPEVDAVCAAILSGRDADSPFAGLARARAAAGAGLAETLADVAALHAVLDNDSESDSFIAPDLDTTPSRLVRLTATAWADVALDQLAHTEVVDSLTGLPTAAYLRTRLSEIYRWADKHDASPATHYTLLVVSIDLVNVTGWPRLTVMVLVGEALRTVFDEGESVALLGPSTAAALIPRGGKIAAQAVRLRRELTSRFSIDRQLNDLDSPRIQIVRPPGSYAAACALLTKYGRS